MKLIYKYYNLIKQLCQNIKKDSLYSNSLYVMLSTFVMAVLGFVFWIIVARLFNPDKVGIATTLISTMMLLGNFGILGLNVSLIRFLPKSHNRSNLINTSLIFSAIASFIAASIFIIGISLFSKDLLFIKDSVLYSILFIIFVIFFAYNNLIDSIFIAYRAAKNILIKNTIISILKLIFPFILVSYAAYGIFASSVIPIVIACFFGLIVLKTKYDYKPRLSIDIESMREMAYFSMGNYITNFFASAPLQLLPLIIIDNISSAYAAYFYIVVMIQNLLLIIPFATSQVMLSEGSYNENELKVHLKKTLIATYALLIPATIFVVTFGNFMLHFFGRNYSIGAYHFLQIFCISIFFTAFIVIGNMVFRIKHQIKRLVFINFLGSVLTLGFSWMMISDKLNGIGYGWLLGQFLISLVYLYFIIQEFRTK